MFLIVLAIALSLGLRDWIPVSWKISEWAIALSVFLLLAPLSLLILHWQLRNYLSLFRALAGTVSSYRDSDYNFSIRWQSDDEIGELVKAHND